MSHLALIGVIVLLLNLAVVKALLRHLRRRDIARLEGCLKPPTFQNHLFFLGLVSLYRDIAAALTHTYLEHERRQHDTYGNTFATKQFLTPVIKTIEPKNLEVVFGTNFENFIVGSRRGRAFGPVIGEASITQDGASWRHSRTLLQSCLRKPQNNLIATIEPHVQNLIQAITKEKAQIDLALVFERFGVEVVMDWLLGVQVDSVLDPSAFGGGIISIIQATQDVCRKRFLLNRLAPLLNTPKWYRNVRTTHNFVKEQIEIAMDETAGSKICPATGGDLSGHKESFLSCLLRQTRDKKEVQDALLGMYFAGADTSAALLGNLFFELSKRPDLWLRLRQDVKLLDERAPTLPELKSLKLVSDCIWESLRLHPVIPSDSRVALADTVLPTGGGPDKSAPIFISSGTTIHLDFFALHRRLDVWGQDANVFNPDRWTSQNQSWEFMPFLKGPRACIGQEFSMIQVSYTLVRLLQAFETLESADASAWTEKLGFVCASRNGVKVRMK